MNHVLEGRDENQVKATEGTNEVFKSIKEQVFAFGDSQMLNETLYENYLTMKKYYDYDFEKTANFLDLFSLDDCREAYVGRTQDYGPRQFSYLPSACLKV